jgi:hypothetical protein
VLAKEVNFSHIAQISARVHTYINTHTLSDAHKNTDLMLLNAEDASGFNNRTCTIDSLVPSLVFA